MQDCLHLREEGQKTYPEIDPPALLEEKEIAAAHLDVSSLFRRSFEKEGPKTWY